MLKARHRLRHRHSNLPSAIAPRPWRPPSLAPVGLGLYATLGSPDIPSQSAFARVDTPIGSQSIGSLVGQVEAHLATNPKDGAGWEVLAPVYMRLGRFNDAAAAWRKAIALNGDDATREAAFGEALVAAANGVVTDQALTAFQHAVAARSARAQGPLFPRPCRRAGWQPRRRRGALARHAR